MQKIVESFTTLSQSVTNGCKDTSLLNKLQANLSCLDTTQLETPSYARLILCLYDLSNHHSLIQNNTPHLFSLKMKLVAMKMICTLMKFISINVSHRLDKEVERQALQIMILSCRLCLDSQLDCPYDILECQHCCDQLFDLYAQDFKDSQYENMYFINRLDLFRITVDSPKFSFPDFAREINNWSKLKVEPQYQNFFQYIVAQVTLKLLRKGFKVEECLPHVDRFLPQKYAQTIRILASNKNEPPHPNQVELGDIYELYWHITTNGINSISLQCLQQFISKDSVHCAEEIFDVILLTDQPILLNIWFDQCNRRVAKCLNLGTAYQCFISLIKKNQQMQQIEEKRRKTGDLTQLNRQVMLNLMRQNMKDTIVPIHTICVEIMRFFISLVSSQIFNDSLPQLFENSLLICAKHSITDIPKVITTLHLYSELISNCARQETYKQFLKFNCNQKTQIVKALKAAYQIQHGGTQEQHSQYLQTLKNKPEFIMLFCQNSSRTLLLLDMDLTSFQAFPNVFNIYSSLLEEHAQNAENIYKIFKHMENFFISSEFSKLKFSLNSLTILKITIQRFIKQKETLYCLVWLYCGCLQAEPEKISGQSFGVVFNKYSKLLKLLDMIKINEQFVNIFQILICESCQKFKAQWVKNKHKCSPEAGQIIFLKLIFKKMVDYDANTNVKEKSQFDFAHFSMFQIYCMNDKYEQIQQILDDNEGTQLQQLLVNSDVIANSHKLKILRRIFKRNLNSSQHQPLITLKQLQQLILLGETNEQCMIYINSVIKIFGEKGKKFLSLLAEQNKRVCQLFVEGVNDD